MNQSSQDEINKLYSKYGGPSLLNDSAEEDSHLNAREHKFKSGLDTQSQSH